MDATALLGLASKGICIANMICRTIVERGLDYFHV